jgi:hypothetical protein
VTKSERNRNAEIRRSKEVAKRFMAIANKIQSVIDGPLWDDLTTEEFQILQNEVELFTDLADGRKGTR